MMKAAEAAALLNYVYNAPSLNTRTKALETCETIMDYADLTLLKVYDNRFIAGVLAQENIELAKLHLADAKKSDKNSTSIATASLAIQEAMIAQSQAQVMMDFSRIHHKNGSILNANSIVSQSDSYSEGMISLHYVMLFLIAVESIALVYIGLKKKRKNPQ